MVINLSDLIYFREEIAEARPFTGAGTLPLLIVAHVVYSLPTQVAVHRLARIQEGDFQATKAYQ